MIRYLRQETIDKKKWDECIDLSINGIFYAYSWYLDMVAGDWDGLVEDDYVSVMPLPVRRKMGLRYVYQPFFVQQMGIFGKQSLSDQLVRDFLDALPPDIHYMNANLNTYNRLPGHDPVVSGHGVTHLLNLIPSYKQSQKAYSQNTRRNIQKAKKAGVFITSHGRPEDIIELFRRNRGKRGVPFKESDYQMLKHLVYSGLHRGMVSIRSAYTEKNDLCAGVVFFFSHHRFVLLFSGADSEARKNGAMALLIDDFIREQSGKPLLLDFEGSSDPNLARFYRGFGSEECVFLQIEKMQIPFVFKPFLKALLAVRHKVRKLHQ